MADIALINNNLASHFHDAWRQNLTNQMRCPGGGKLSTDCPGETMIDIAALDYAHLPPFYKKANDTACRVALEVFSLYPDNEIAGGYYIHKKWMANSEYARKANPHQFQPFYALSTEEQGKDIIQYTIVRDLVGKYGMPVPTMEEINNFYSQKQAGGRSRRRRKTGAAAAARRLLAGLAAENQSALAAEPRVINSFLFSYFLILLYQPLS